MSSRPVVSVFNHKDSSKVAAQVKMPHVFLAPVRNDIVNFVHDQLSRNRQQAHGVDPKAGMKHSAESWGTGRAVARIPRVSGSGTHRSGQGAFGNMCAKGRMAHPLHTWRRWHRKVNVNQRRHALASAVAATACVPLVIARGHRVMNVPQLPLILDDSVGKVSKAKEAIAMLKSFGAYDDVKRVITSKKMRCGKGKMRNRRMRMKRGPLFVVDSNAEDLRRALRNLPGVDVCNVSRLNLMQLAPGGHLGRFCVWTEGAFKALEKHFGSTKGSASLKKGYRLQHEVCTNADLSQIINSDEVQKVLKTKQVRQKRHHKTARNPLRNARAMNFLNPHAKVLKEQRQKAAGVRRKITKEEKKVRNTRSSASRKLHRQILAKCADNTQKNQDTFKGLLDEMRVH